MGKATCIVIGDPHFKTNNTVECQALITKVCAAVDKFKPDFVVCLGDLLDKHETIHETPFNLATKFMKELSARSLTFLIVGNHDYCNNQQFLSDRHPYNAMKEWANLIVVDQVKVYPFKDFEFLFVPYVPPGRFKEALVSYDMWDTCDCIFAHQEFYGCKMGAITSSEGDRWDDDFPLVISGHIHTAQTIGTNIHYVGSSMQHAFGDTDDKRIWLCEFDDSNDETFSFKKINLKLQKKHLMYVDLKDVAKLAKDLQKFENDQVKVNIKCSYEEYKAFVKTPEFKKLSGKKDIRLVHAKTSRILNENIEQFKAKKLKELNGVVGYENVFKKLIDDEGSDMLRQTYESLTH